MATIEQTIENLTIENLIAYVDTKKNWQIEVSDMEGFWEGYKLVGVHKGNEIWHWFRVSESNHFQFLQSYNRNTGQCKKGTMHGINQVISLQNGVTKMLEKRAEQAEQVEAKIAELESIREKVLDEEYGTEAGYRQLQALNKSLGKLEKKLAALKPTASTEQSAQEETEDLATYPYFDAVIAEQNRTWKARHRYALGYFEDEADNELDHRVIAEAYVKVYSFLTSPDYRENLGDLMPASCADMVKKFLDYRRLYLQLRKPELIASVAYKIYTDIFPDYGLGEASFLKYSGLKL